MHRLRQNISSISSDEMRDVITRKNEIVVA